MTHLPPGARCGVNGCEARAKHPEHPAPRCEDHLPTGNNAGGDPTVEADKTTPDDGPGSEASEDDSPDTAGPSYRDLYLRAWASSDADQALLPHEDIAPVFREAGYGEIINHGALPYSEWTVWTPDSREEPLYAYTPDLAGDTSAERERVAELLSEADLGTERFIDVLDGQKASFDTGNARTPDDAEVAGNYGVKGGRAGDTDRWLVDIDVDDYDEAKESNPRVEALRGETLGVASAHTTTDRPGHLYVAVDGDAAAIARDVLGREVDNPTASFGEIRVENQYVVGPGSEIVCGCELCEDPDTADHYGRYELATERPPVVWSPEEFRAFLEADPAIEPDSDGGDADADGDGDSGRQGGSSGSVSLDDTDARVTLAKAVDDHVADAFREATSPDDRSAADSRLARAIAPWVGYDDDDISDVLDDHGTSKWDNRGDSYHSSVVDYATDRTTDAYDPLPYWALVEAAVADDLVDRDDLVARSSETGEVLEDPEAADVDTYRALPSGTYNDALAHVRDEYGVDPGRDPIEGTADREDDVKDDSDPRDLLALDVVVEPANALAAAGAVEPADLCDEADLPELEREDVSDVAIAVALREGWIDTPDEFPEDGRYTEAYYRARDRFGAPLPKYLDNSTLEERTELVFAALDRVRPEHVLDALESEITVADPAGEAIAKINPTWEESNSGERILAGYGAGFYCTEHSPHQPKGNHTFDALQVVALEHGLVEDEFTRPSGEAFKQAYRLLREKYDAPVPRWRATLVETVPVLPPAVQLLDDDVRVSDSASETLQEARDRTEALVRDAVGVRTRGQLITALPGTGKTYSAIAAAADRPTLYVTRRNDLKTQAEEYAAEIAADDDHHPDAEPSVAHLPILAENVLPDAAVREGVAAVREEGFDFLRDRHEELYERVAPKLEDDGGDTDATDDDTVDFDRGTCETAEGEYGDRWRVRVHIARALGLQPADLHRAAEALFGEPLPCQCDDHDHGEGDSAECELSVAWDRIRDPDRPLDLLVGSPEHAFVDSATTYYERDADGDRVKRERAVVIDEFPEESYFSQYAGRYMDHATWLAEALVDIDTREDLLAADLAADTWVDRWLDGEGGEYGEAADAIDALAAAADIADATDHAAEVLDRGRLDAVAGVTSVNLRQLRATLETVADADPDADLGDAVNTLNRAVDRVEKDAAAAYADGRDAAGEAYALVDDLEATLDALTRGLDAVDTGETGVLETVRERVATLPVGGDLRALLEDAVDATRGDGPAGILDAATTALRGGRDGCRELALFANGGYAHPDAWAHLAGAIADADHDDVREVSSEAFTFDPEREGGRFKRFTRNGARILADKNHHGELVVDPPAFTDATGSRCPVIGLDATGRPELWKIAIGRDTDRRDIHQTDAERRRFLRDTVDLTVVQTADSPLPYHGPPDNKNFQEDLALVREVAAEYTEGADALDDKGPAVMSTQKVLKTLEDDLAPYAGATVEYESMKGSDALGDHQVAVLLGSQHYSDAVPEKWGLVAGESPGRGDTKGAALDYGSDVANAYLQYMRDDHTMQGILRAGRNDDTTVVFAHTSALRPDLPVDAEGALVSAHSKGTLQVVEAAAELRGGRFTAPDVAEALGADGVGLRQVQNVLADLRESGYVDVHEAGSRGRAYEYDSVEDPGVAEVELPDVDTSTVASENETPTLNSYSWDFVFDAAARGGDTPREASGPTIPASTAVDPAATEAGPPG